MTFENEIRETPDALQRLLHYWRSVGRQMAARLALEDCPVRDVVFTGMGSSLNAAYPAKYLLARHGIAVRIEPASELYYDLMHTVRPDTLVLAVSQSGETIETNKVLSVLNGRRRLWVVANNEASPMAASGRPFFAMNAGQETRSSSKTYTNTLALLYLVAEQIAGGRETIPDVRWDAMIDAAAATLAQSESFADQMLGHWGVPNRLQVVARGSSLASAHEFSLLVAENSSVVVQPIDGGTFRHGFNRLAGEGHRILFLVSESPTVELSEAIAAQVAGQGSRVIVLSTAAGAIPKSHQASNHNGVLHLSLPDIAPGMAPLLEMLPLEFLTLKLALCEGRDPGQLESKVTREE